MKLIPLTHGFFAKVDDEDFESLSAFRWYRFASRKDQREGGTVRPSNNYALRTYWQKRIGDNPPHRKIISMHRMLMRPKPGEVVDHINRDGLDNQKSNLRLCTRSQNSGNSGRYISNKTSRFKGVSELPFPESNRWIARLMVGGKRVLNKRYPDEESAARAYDAAAKKYRGEFVVLNFPQ